MKPLEHLDQAIHPSVLFNEMINLSNIDFLRVQRHMEKIQFQVDTDFTLSLGPYSWDVYQPNYSSDDIYCKCCKKSTRQFQKRGNL